MTEPTPEQPEILADRQREYGQLQTAIQQVERGEIVPLDMEEIKRRGRARIAAPDGPPSER